MPGEKVEEKSAAEEYDKAWDELDKADAAKSKTSDEPADDEPVDDAEEKKPEEGEKPEEKPEEKPPEEAAGQEPTGVEKALRDTKVWATTLAEENAELKRRMDALEKGKATQADVDAQKKLVDDSTADVKKMVETISEDYPELKDLFDKMIGLVENVSKKADEAKRTVIEDKETRKHREALQDFNTHIKPKILLEHPDYDQVLGINEDGTANPVKIKEYQDWADTLTPGDKFKALNSGHPDDIRWALREFKKFKGTPEAKALKDRQDKDRKDRITNAQTLRGGSHGIPANGMPQKDPNDYDAGWEEAGRTLKKQGVASG